MVASEQFTENQVAETPPPGPRGQVALAWVVIALLVLLVVGRNAWRSAGVEPATDSGMDNMEMVTLKVQGRYLLGLSRMGFPLEPILNQGEEMFLKSPMHRLAFITLLAEIQDRDTALERLAELETTTEDEAWAAELLTKVYLDEQIDPSEEQWLQSKLRWFAQLALSDEGSEARYALYNESRRTVVVLFTLVGLGVLALMIGLVLITFLGMALLQGWIRFAPPQADHRGVYLETFALYLAVYMGGSYALTHVPLRENALAANGLLILACLGVVAWPVLRGVSWRQTCEDMGLRMRWADVALGVPTYLVALPQVLAGALLMFGIMRLLRLVGLEVSQPTHPLAEAGLGVTWWQAVQIVFVAAICAPIVEEVFFRGALYAGISQSARGWSTFARVSLAIGLSSFIFAVIHPQGFLGVLILGPLAGAFALAREWRGSIVPGVVAHAINNGLITAVLLLAIA
jgi:membrane protease YdiL (CAAX protease family)